MRFIGKFCSFFPLALLLAGSWLAFGQLTPSTPSKEYIRLNGQVIAIENQPAAAQSSPTVTITSPTQGQTFGSAQVTISATATDSGATIQSVTFTAGGSALPQPQANGTTYTTTWNTAGVASGAYTIVATATDSNGHTGTSSVSVSVSNGVGSTGTGNNSLDLRSGQNTWLADLSGVSRLANLSTWRLEMRIHNIAPSAAANKEIFWAANSLGVGMWVVPDGSSLNLQNVLENPPGSMANQSYCQVALNGATDVQVRLQRSGLVYNLWVWNTASKTLLPTSGDCGSYASGNTVSLNSQWFIGGEGSPIYDLTGGIAYLRFYTSAATGTTAPPDLPTGNELLAYEFENASAIGAETNGNPAATLIEGVAGIYPTPTAGSTPAPTVQISTPTAGQTVSGASVALAATASAAAGASIQSVVFQVDGVNLSAPVSVSGSTYTTTWNSTQVSNASHAITAVATDSNGKSTQSSPVQVTVSNTTPQNSVYFNGSTTMTANLSSVSGLASLTGWRMETRVHGFGSNPAAIDQMIWAAWTSSKALVLLWISGDGSTVWLSNGLDNNQAYCSVPLNGATDVEIRLQRLSSGYQLQAWQTGSTTPLPTSGSCGTLSGSTVSLQSAWYLGGEGGNIYGYSGAMAFFRVYQSGVSSTSPPPSAPAGSEFVAYEFENGSALGQETSGNGNPALTVAQGTPTQISTPGSGALVAPTVSLSSPTASSTVGATVNLTATASAMSGASITSVQFSVDGVLVGTVSGSGPYTYAWNSTTVANNSQHKITATATDSNLMTATSQPVAVTVSNSGASSGGAYSLKLDGNTGWATDLSKVTSLGAMTAWRFETRVHGIVANGNAIDQIIWSLWNTAGMAVGVWITPDGSTLKFQNALENVAGSVANVSYCSVPLGGATDIQIRLQRTAGGSTQLFVWNTSTGLPITTPLSCGSATQPTVSLAGAWEVGGEGTPVYNFTGGIAYFRVYGSSAASATTAPLNLPSGSEMVAFEFENSIDIGKETNGLPELQVSSGGNAQVMNTPAGGN